MCANFAYVLLHNCLRDFGFCQIRISIFTLKKLKKKSRGYGAQISETGVSVDHTFDVFGEFSTCFQGCAIFMGTLFARKFQSRISILKKNFFAGNILLGNLQNSFVEHVMESQYQLDCFKKGKIYISISKIIENVREF